MARKIIVFAPLHTEQPMQTNQSVTRLEWFWSHYQGAWHMGLQGFLRAVLNPHWRDSSTWTNTSCQVRGDHALTNDICTAVEIPLAIQRHVEFGFYEPKLGCLICRLTGKNVKNVKRKFLVPICIMYIFHVVQSLHNDMGTSSFGSGWGLLIILKSCADR